MSSTNLTPTRSPEAAGRSEGRGPRSRRRTLGLCAHCQEPVEVGGEHVRLYRLAWHLDCALASGASAAQFAPPQPD